MHLQVYSVIRQWEVDNNKVAELLGRQINQLSWAVQIVIYYCFVQWYKSVNDKCLYAVSFPII